MEDNNDQLTTAPKKRGPKPGFNRKVKLEPPVVDRGEAVQVVPNVEELTVDAAVLSHNEEKIDRAEYQKDIERIEELRRPMKELRNPFGTFSQKLALAPRAGYHTHWFNDSPGRIDEAKIAGWTHRKDDKGKPTRRVVGTGRDKGALYAYAMDIPLVFWEEDQQAQFDRAKAMTDDIKGNPIKAKTGSLTKQDDRKFYTPREITIKTE